MGWTLPSLSQLSDRLRQLRADDLVDALRTIPSGWPVTDEELEAVGWFLQCRAVPVADRLDGYSGEGIMRFVYSLVRFVPDPARGEFVNVGAIAGSEESSDWGCSPGWEPGAGSFAGAA